MRILFATQVLPFTKQTGGDVVSLSIIELLKELGCTVHVLGYLRHGARLLPEWDAEVVSYRPVETGTAPLTTLAWLGRSILTGRPFTSTKFHSRTYGQLVRETLDDGAFDLAIIDHTQLAWLLDWIPPYVPRVIVLHNAESELYAAQSDWQKTPIHRAIYRREAQRLRALEQTIASSGARVWLLNADNLSGMGQVSGGTVVLPVMPTADRHYPTQADFDIGLLGTWSWLPNAQGLRWFFDRVLRHLPAHISIRVAGSGADRIGGVHLNVVYAGYVPDAALFMRNGRVFAIPTPLGSGVETKTLMAIQNGCTIVGTSASMRGLGMLPSTVGVADDPECFAAALAEAVQRPSDQMRLEDARRWCETRRQDFVKVLRNELNLFRRSDTRRSTDCSANPLDCRD